MVVLGVRGPVLVLLVSENEGNVDMLPSTACERAFYFGH